jgi:hypothetical protein
MSFIQYDCGSREILVDSIDELQVYRGDWDGGARKYHKIEILKRD